MPEFLDELIATGQVVDIILATLAIEALVLIAWGRGPLVAIAAALPGVCLLLALRGSLTGAGTAWIAFWLAASFPAHLADLKLRPPK